MKDGDTASWPRLRVKRVARANKVTEKGVALFRVMPLC